MLLSPLSGFNYFILQYVELQIYAHYKHFPYPSQKRVAKNEMSPRF